MNSPGRPRPVHPFLDHPGPIAFAHRGGAGDAPENTLAAFAAAVELGYRYLETDVHATADGILVAFHDQRLDRVTDRRGLIAELPWAEVARARVAGREPIPRLEELLETWPQVRVNIDPKHDAAVEPLVTVLRQPGVLERVCVGSFSGPRLARLRAVFGSGLCTSLGPRGVVGLRLDSWGAPGAGACVEAEHADCVQVPVRRGIVPLVDRRFILAAHRRGLPVHVWTVNEPAEMVCLLELGVDGLMTDRPALLREVLTARGQWG